ncbi:UbiA prenyltransferase family protein [Actinoplanes sp. NEAU-A12]|uniref:UbiA prenyltransferase family protein n=1 Tax=Actinoplanes sandaracinus TaxID=3045177 RepID=A0ABT6WI19_9ACTN|nr:UbiA prenyltransferase family protein [Actinoplanes sandaracinus]MDI6099383.1 UbiA prenyltransferase family protein [Actinoplanes sandaracinus]
MTAVDTAVPLNPPVARVANGLRDLVTLIRPHQWAKNLLVVPLVLLDGTALNLSALFAVAWAVLGFTVASSAVYVFNDIADRHRDRLHPVKQLRPVASGRVGVGLAYAYGMMLVLLLIAVAVSGPVTPAAWWPLLVYLALNVAYSRGLKHVPLIDVFVVALGFVLRVVQGYVAAGTPVAGWLLVAVFSLCLVMILGKRRHEVGTGGALHRPSLRGYSTQYLDYMIVLCSVLAVSAFLLYVDDAFPAPYGTAALLGSVPFGLFALARYLQALVVLGDGGDPVRVLLRDRTMVVTSLLWALVLGSILLTAQLVKG